MERAKFWWSVSGFLLCCAIIVQLSMGMFLFLDMTHPELTKPFLNWLWDRVMAP